MDLIKMESVLSNTLPRDIMLYEKAGFVCKANKMKVEYLREQIEAMGFKSTELHNYTGKTCVTEITKSGYFDYRHWDICSVENYCGDIPAAILEKMVDIKDKEKLFILRPHHDPDPVLVYRLPYQKHGMICIVLAEWE